MRVLRLAHADAAAICFLSTETLLSCFYAVLLLFRCRTTRLSDI